MRRIFLMSPANTGGERARMLFREQAAFDVALRLRRNEATIGEIYSFISGLYFRGKLAYIEAFGTPPVPAVVIVPGIGLVPPSTPVSLDQLRAIATVPVDHDNETYVTPLLRDARLLKPHGDEFVLLGSVASEKYTRPLLEVFGDGLLFPAEFVGRGDMSRGGLMLRCARSGKELTYIPVRGAVLRGRRPPKLEKWPKRSS